MEYENEPRGDYDRSEYRQRSRSPRADRDGDTRIRSASPRAERGPVAALRAAEEDEAPNEGTNLFVTGIHPSLVEEEIQHLFEKYGDVESCHIMRDPHTRESRGFGFVKMMTSDQAEAAKSGLNGEVHQGRTLSIEPARRSKPRDPTPGKYYGPPKRDDRSRRGGAYGDRYDDRRGYGRRDDYGRRDYRDRHDDRGYSRRDRDDYGPPRYRDDRYGGRDERRRWGGSGYGGSYDRPSRGPPGDGPGYGDSAAPSRSYDDDRYSRR